ncbi:24441_t:CDS:2 [Dentiscutata erythropus]|uniref:24441_t:CDS:1 n=1 Tax=Dentiscutata erythropus TaxID=1348616 RepID=A0A9N9CD78_9GLOM|nr:24441_t:CDS:2 [Dentiscutata erythropus]
MLLRTGDRIKYIEVTEARFGCLVYSDKMLYINSFGNIRKFMINLLSEYLYKNTTLESLSSNLYISHVEANSLKIGEFFNQFEENGMDILLQTGD